MKRPSLLRIIATLTLLAAYPALAAVPTVSVNFQGRDGSVDQTGNPGVPGFGTTATAGVVPVKNWNDVDDAHAFTPAESGSFPDLIGSDGNTTLVTLNFACNDSWYNDVTPTNLTNPNAILLNGIIKVSAGGGVPGTFTFTNVPEGQYDLYLYTSMNGDGTVAAFSDADFLTTYYVTLQHQVYDTNVFVQGTNTDLSSPSVTNIVNYVKFSNLGTYGRGQLGAVASWVRNNDGIGIAGLELVNIGPAVANTNPVSFTLNPYNRRVLVGDTNITLTVAAKGPVFGLQWFKNGTAIAGATDKSYTLPAIAAGDAGASFTVVASNNVNTATSSPGVITIGQLVQVPGVFEQLWFGMLRTDVNSQTGTVGSTPPDKTLALGTFGSPEEQGDNFAERLACLFVAPVTANYTWFITSDDDSDMYVSTDANPAHIVLVAQEVDWANPLAWVSNDGGTGNRQVQQKRSDQWSPDGGTTVPFASGIHMVAGTTYYIEADHHEGGGGDKVDVTYKLTTDPDPQNGDPSRINAFSLAPYVMALNGAVITVTNPPQNTAGTQSLPTTFTIGATSSYVGDNSGAAPGISYQWQTAPSGSSTFTNIPGANGTSFTTGILKLSDAGTQFRVAMLAGDAGTNSAVATLSVNPDITPPRPTTVTSVGADSRTVTVTFNELMDSASASNAASYVFNPGNIVATNASLDSSGLVVTVITGTKLTQTVTNVLSITGVKDLAGNPVAPGTSISFTFQLVTYAADILFDGPLGFYEFEDAAGSTVAHNSGSTGGDGAYYTGDETSPGSGGTPVAASGDPGPRPPDFVGFAADNNAATFDGVTDSRWVDTKNQFLQARAAFTLEYWVRPTNRVADSATFGTRIGLVGQNDAIEYGFIDANTIQIWTPNGGSLNTTYTFADNEWHHVATIADGTSLKTYYDGKLDGTGGNATGNYGSSTFNVHIGGGGVFDGTGNYFTGNIDEVAIFDKAIPADRVAAHYAAGKNGGVITKSLTVTPEISNLRLTATKSGNNLIITWSPAGGTLQSTPALSGATSVWTAVGTANPATVPIGAGNLFLRVAQ